jgi:hypothetical protein
MRTSLTADTHAAAYALCHPVEDPLRKRAVDDGRPEILAGRPLR